MIFHIAKKEMKQIGRSSSFIWILAITVLIGFTSIYISSNQFNEKQEKRELASDGERERWLGQGDKNPHSSAHYGTYAFKPAYALSLIDPGVEKFTGVSVFLESHTRNEAEQVAAADQTGLSRFGDITPDFILLFIVPLIIIILGHNSITREKTDQTLRLVKVQGIGNFRFIIGKWLGNYLPIFLLTTILFLIFTVAVASTDPTFDWRFVVAMNAVYLIYYAIITSMVITVSALSKNSGISLVSLLAIWIVSCLAIPKIASSYTNSEYPYPSRQQFQAAVTEDKQKGVDGHNPWSKASKELAEETMNTFNVSSLEELPFNFDAYRMQKGEEHEARVYFKHYENLKSVYQNQTEVYQKLAILSPYLPVRFLSMSIAHTDYSTHWNFTNEAEKHRLQMQKILNNNFAQNSKLGEWDYKADASLLAEIPEFEFKSPSFSDTLKYNRTNFLILGIWSFASFGFLIIASKRI